MKKMNIILLKERLFKLWNEPKALRRFLLRHYFFGFFEKFGIHTIADHFYEPIPNISWIKKNYDENKLFFPAGTKWDFANIELSVSKAITEYGGEFTAETDQQGYRDNYYFFGWDALCLYTYLRSKKIKTVVEIGQGFSTLIHLAALGKNRSAHKVATKFISIDPYSRLESQQSSANSSEVSIECKRVQEVDAEKLLSLLGPYTLLFVDSSHVYKTGSDVEFLMREVYPYLPSGTHLHIHDIYSPYPWPKKNFVERKWFWNEQDMLEQFLAFNEHFSLELPAYWLYKNNNILRHQVTKLRTDLFCEGYGFYLRKK